MLLMLYLITIEILPGELPSNIITLESNSIHLDYWKITEDRHPEKQFISYPDSLWKEFNPSLEDERFNIGNWLIRTNIIIEDSLDSKEVYGLFPINLVTAFEIYWDDIKIGQTGILGRNISEEKAGDFNYSLVLPANLLTQGKHTIVIRLSSYNSNSSWKWFYGDIVIGKYDYILNKLSRLNYQAFFIIGILFIPFLFNLILYFYRKRKTEHLLFGIICFIVILDSTTSLIPVLFNTKTTFIFWQYHAYNTITLLFTILFPVFFIYLFSFPKKIIGLIIIITVVIFFFFTNIENVFKVMTLTVLILSSMITLWAFFKRKKESIVTIIGIIAAWAAYYFNFAFAGLATTMVISTSFSIAQQFARKEKTEKEAQLKSAQLETELLKKNINPHFVLNTLTSVIVWLRKDSASAIKLIEALAEEFRMINQISALKQIPITQEIDLCRAHLKIMGYRKGADYSLETIDIDEKETVPPMIFHTLVENGITHGYEKKIKGTFKLELIKNQNSKKYILTNDGDFNPEDTKGSTGFGAKYIKSRLEESYPGKWSFTSNKCDTGWQSIIEIRI
jgi:sensor histidine kinase YesM